jgi:hypothetical protein
MKHHILRTKLQRHTPFALLRILLSPDERQDFIDLEVY